MEQTKAYQFRYKRHATQEYSHVALRHPNREFDAIRTVAIELTPCKRQIGSRLAPKCA